MGNWGTKEYIDPAIMLAEINTSVSELSDLYVANINNAHVVQPQKLTGKPGKPGPVRGGQVGGFANLVKGPKQGQVQSRKQVPRQGFDSVELEDVIPPEPPRLKVRIPEIPEVFPLNPDGLHLYKAPVENKAPVQNVCQNMEEMLRMKLLNLKSRNIKYLNADLKLNMDTKKEICEAIVEHFRDRLVLIKTIKEGLAFCNVRINNFTNEGFCSNNNPLYNKSNCIKSSYSWTHVDEVLRSNYDIVDSINVLKNRYNKYLTELYGLLDLLKSTVSIDSYQLEVLTRKTYDLLRRMQVTCDEAYVTITENIISSSNAARQDALRISRAVPVKYPKPGY